jgi:hypothetical protein
MKEIVIRPADKPIKSRYRKRMHAPGATELYDEQWVREKWHRSEADGRLKTIQGKT